MLIELKSYRLAKQYAADYLIIEKIISLTITGLETFKYYKPIANLIYELKNTQTIMRAHASTAEKLLQRGKTTDEP